jgi:hypothetical protein
LKARTEDDCKFFVFGKKCQNWFNLHHHHSPIFKIFEIVSIESNIKSFNINTHRGRLDEWISDARVSLFERGAQYLSQYHAVEVLS